jgi:hypothetical protein
MQLRDFVAETLKEIIDGVIEAQRHYQDKGGSVASGVTYAGTSSENRLWNSVTRAPAQVVEFDVAVTAAEGTETKGSIGVFIGAIGLGSHGKSESSNTSVSRIKFSVPIILPEKTISP